MHPHFRVIPFFLVRFVMLVSVDTRLWFCMGSEFTSLTLTREPVLRIHLHEMIAIYSWLVTGQQWMEHSVVLPKRKSHLNPWWASSGSPEWIRRNHALVTSIELPALCGHENAQQHKRHKILFPLFPLSYIPEYHPDSYFMLGKILMSREWIAEGCSPDLGRSAARPGTSTSAFLLLLSSVGVAPRVHPKVCVKVTVQIKQGGTVNSQKLLCFSSLICSWYLGYCCDNSASFF